MNLSQVECELKNIRCIVVHQNTYTDSKLDPLQMVEHSSRLIPETWALLRIRRNKDNLAVIMK